MQSSIQPVESVNSRESLRAEALFREHQQQIFRRTDRLFACLMPLQWAAAIAAACWISPRTWEGASSFVHMHVWLALVFGGTVTCVPVALALLRPGEALTRHIIAVGQMLMSGLLIHLTGGRIETHFHVFGSLAFLAFYRDWRVFVPATIIVAADHLLRNLFWPESVFGIVAPSPWRWLEHAGWVLFEDTFLLISTRQSAQEMRDIARQRAKLESTQQRIEAEVIARTTELSQLQKQNLEVARRVGMAEIATNVLHNVGNVLNSVNVSASVIGDRLRKSGTPDLRRATNMLEANLADVGTFLTADKRGRHLPQFLIELSQQMASDEQAILEEVLALTRNIEHIKDIVSVQQSYTGVSGLLEEVDLAELLDDAIRINSASLGRHHVEIVREYAQVGPVKLPKQKFLQILVNVLSNAKDSVLEAEATPRRIVVRLTEQEQIRVEVVDNGVGIAADNLTRIFAHGFTTRRGGHGFGLHSAANLAREMGGTLRASSDGPGQGATFVLELPRQPVEATHD